MSNKNNKTLILNRIKEHYGFKKNIELAKFLGIAPTTLSSWYSRNSLDYDMVVAKCVGMDLNDLFREEGYNSKSELGKVNEPDQNKYDASELLALISEKDKQIRKMAEEVGRLKEQNRGLKKQIKH